MRNRFHYIDEDTIAIELLGDAGAIALVDASDLPVIDALTGSWRTAIGYSTRYVHCAIWNGRGNQKWVKMHRLLAALPAAGQRDLRLVAWRAATSLPGGTAALVAGVHAGVLGALDDALHRIGVGSIVGSIRLPQGGIHAYHASHNDPAGEPDLAQPCRIASAPGKNRTCASGSGDLRIPRKVQHECCGGKQCGNHELPPRGTKRPLRGAPKRTREQALTRHATPRGDAQSRRGLAGVSRGSGAGWTS